MGSVRLIITEYVEYLVRKKPLRRVSPTRVAGEESALRAVDGFCFFQTPTTRTFFLKTKVPITPDRAARAGRWNDLSDLAVDTEHIIGQRLNGAGIALRMKNPCRGPCPSHMSPQCH